MGSENDPNNIEVLSISSRRDGAHVVVELEGELDLHGSDRLAVEVQQALREPVELLELDATRLTFADSAGLRAVLMARSEAESNGAVFRIIAVSAPVGRVIEIAGLGDLLLPAGDG
ncbi:MAG TPA: STAS domain-containing protein [Acidimicrobiales bacterium]|jgi:stage II sporulation protein AA (anti-sigma F factor antagonist)|nr:STAS domain-containing protein [Acidimicrobiales bacterium]